jgi:hypothetical protein
MAGGFLEMSLDERERSHLVRAFPDVDGWLDPPLSGGDA